MKNQNNKVQQYREERLWNISELAKRSELTPQTVSKMEKGSSTSRLSELKVARAFDLPHEKVFPSDNKID